MSDADPATTLSDTTTDAPEVDRFALLDLDGPTAPAPLPVWAERVIAVIRAIAVGLTLESTNAAFAALSRAIEPARAYPEGPGKVAVRAELALKQGEINARLALLRSAPAAVAQPATAPPPATVRQAIPVQPAGVEHVATWAKLPDGEWGARITSRLGAPVAGDVVIVHRNRGQGVSRRYFVSFADNGVAVVANNPPTGATVAASVPAIGSAPSETPSALDTNHHAAEINELATEPNATSLESSLGGIVAESAANASAPVLGSMANGARGGVGFRLAEGYTQALAQGVKLATAEEYKRILRTNYNHTDAQIAALTVTIIPEGTGTGTGGVVHTPPAGSVGYFEPAARAERAALKAGSKNETRGDVRRLLGEKDLIAGAVASGSMLQVSWVGGGSTTLGKVREALAAIGREHDAPGAPSSVRHAGRAVEALRSREWDTTRLPNKDLPDGIAACWAVGRKLSASVAKAGDPLGTAALIVRLTDSDQLTFDGDQTLAAGVLREYNAATQHETLKSEDLTAWMGRTLKQRHYAVKRGPVWYVPGGQADAARQLSETIAKLWGDHERIPVTTGADLMRSLTRGLTDECTAIETELAKLTGDARDRAKAKAIEECAERNAKAQRYNRSGAGMMSQEAIDAAADLAWKRATVSATIAARLMRSLATVAARIEGYTAVLGDESTASAKAKVIELRNQIEPLCSDFDQRAAMLEFA